MRLRTSRNGLTAIELVSALALFVLVLGALLVALDSATDIWSQSTAKNRTQQKARNALDRLADDLASAFAEPLLRPDGTRPPAANSPSSAEFPLFIAENNGNRQIGVYFVRQRSPSEMSGGDHLSLELVAYAWMSNCLSRYQSPVSSADRGLISPRLSDQLVSFKNEVTTLAIPTNVLLSAAVQFVPLVYQPLHPAITASDTQPIEALNSDGKLINLADLPDFVDILLAYVDQQEGAANFSRTNYMTRRVTLPAARASRLP